MRSPHRSLAASLVALLHGHGHGHSHHHRSAAAAAAALNLGNATSRRTARANHLSTTSARRPVLSVAGGAIIGGGVAGGADGSGPAGQHSRSPHPRSSRLAGAAAAVTATALAAATAAPPSGMEEASSSPSSDPRHHQRPSTSPFPEECVRLDTYNGVSVDISTLPTDMTSDPTGFGDLLERALESWKKEGRRGVWITIPREYAALIPVCVDLGFDFQHAERGGHGLVLTAWLPEDSESRLPHGPTHQVGIGALVLHPTRPGKMLVVREKSGPAAARKLWKMPTGLTDPGEDIADAAVRELKEEVGLDCVFDQIVCFRQAHGAGQFGDKSDMFFVCQLRLDPRYEERLLTFGEEIQLIPQEEEIASAMWVDMEDYFDQELWHSSPLYREMNNALLSAAKNTDVTQRQVQVGRESEEHVLGEDSEGGGTGRKEPQHEDGFTGRINFSSRPSTSSSAAYPVGFVGKKLPVGFRPGTNTLYVASRR